MKRAVLIFPGRGTYNAPELGYIARHIQNPELLAKFDAMRHALGQETLTALDAAQRFEAKRHTTSDNASALIFTSGIVDFQAIDPSSIELVAVTGNSMGWYTALAAAGGVSFETGFEIANTMGELMHQNAVGGQVIYPHTGDNWVPDPTEKARLLALVAEINARQGHTLALSIDLGGMLVLAGDSAGLRAFELSVPKRDRFPLRLAHHAAFHTRLMGPISVQGLAHFGVHRFKNPALPLIDGRGQIWWPHATEPEALRGYTLGTQVTEAYDFTHAIRIAAREFAPDVFILAGPGNALGGAVGQSLIDAAWRGLSDKVGFQTVQKENPCLISMGRQEQRGLVA